MRPRTEYFRRKGETVAALAWWLIPIIATLFAVAWVTWRARPRRPADPHESLAAHRRFTEAMSLPPPRLHAPDEDADAPPADRRSA